MLLVAVKIQPGEAADAHDLRMVDFEVDYPHMRYFSAGMLVWGHAIVENDGSSSETAIIRIVASGVLFVSKFGSHLWSNTVAIGSIAELPPGRTFTFNWVWNTRGWHGKITLAAVANPVPGEQNVRDNTITGPTLEVMEKGYVIIMASSGIINNIRAFGESAYDESYYNYLNVGLGCSHLYDTLIKLGYPANDIYYMAGSANTPPLDARARAPSTKAELQYAIETWAAGRVNSYEPLTLFMVGGLCGKDNEFWTNGYGNTNYDIITPHDLADWLQNGLFFKAKGITGDPPLISAIIDSTGSQSFLMPVYDGGYGANIVITSLGSSDNPDRGWRQLSNCYFTKCFCDQIGLGYSLYDSFNLACHQYNYVTAEIRLHSWSGNYLTVYPSPQYYDGNGGQLGRLMFPADCEWPDPWISEVMASPTYSWPPSNVTVWAKVDNQTTLSSVNAFMVAPNGSSHELFEMSEMNETGIWSVTVPAVNFTNYSSGPGNFTFVITAEETNGESAESQSVNVQFTSSGEPSPDVTAPSIQVVRPMEDAIASGDIVLNGTVSDDTCIDRVEVYSNDTLLGTFHTAPTSMSYFQVDINTTAFPNGNTAFLVEAFDKAGNSVNQTINVYILNFVHDVAITDLSVGDNLYRGQPLRIDVTAANDGSYPEVFNVSAYANSTLIGTFPATLSSQNYTTLSFTLNTTSFPYGNYTVSACIESSSQDTSTWDKNGTTDPTDPLKITLLGDVNFDFKVDLSDLVLLANAWRSTPSDPNWNPSFDIAPPFDVIGLTDLCTLALHYGWHA